jgi:FkbH-like protein
MKPEAALFVRGGPARCRQFIGTGHVNLIEALEILKQPVPENGHPLRAFLACGFTPRHLQTFLAAHLRERLPQRRVEVRTGLFGDLAGNIERLEGSSCDVVSVVIEWHDLDLRLGIRSLGGWRTADLPDIVKSANQAVARLEQALRRVSAAIPTCVCMPTLPIPPVFTTPTHQAGGYELQLRQLVASLAASISNEPRIRILNAQRLDEFSPRHARLDVRSELTTGFPYKLPHASTVAELMATLIHNPTPKKGLITDLDDTLWAGILGEVGTDGVSWHLDQHTHMHGLFQQFLDSLASAGVLIAVASKNDRALVEQAFERKDLIISKEDLYPLEVHWARKSESVQRILKTWNIGPEAVVFIDDSPMEVAEVKAAFPETECVVFPKNDYQAIGDLLKRLRDLFGKSVISEEDSIRLKSIRGAEAVRGSVDVADGSLDGFLQGAEASIRFSFGKQAGDRRALELINKTNQFNLNGKRMTESDLLNYLKDPKAFLVTATYEDKYGPLGKIAVLMGRPEGRQLVVDTWVMSCRAFSRRIEHHFLKYLFEKFSADEIVFVYQATARNGPLQEFFAQLLGVPPEIGLRLSRSCFSERTPHLFHQVEEVSCG